jgi:hypothetical protein
MVTYKPIYCYESTRNAYKLFKYHYLFTNDVDEKDYGRVCLEPIKRETLTEDSTKDINQLDIKVRYCKNGETSNGKTCQPNQKIWYEFYVGVCIRDSKLDLENLTSPLGEKL